MRSSAPVGSSSSNSGSTRNSIETSSRSISVDDRQVAAHRTPGRVVVEADVGEVRVLRVGVDAEPVQQAHRVRARELHARLGVDEDHAVTDAGRALDLDLVEVERERPVGDHAGEPLERLEVGALELAGAGGRTSTDARGSAARSACPHRRTGMHCTRTRSLAPIACVSASTDSPARQQRASNGRSTSSTTVPTRSCG